MDYRYDEGLLTLGRNMKQIAPFSIKRKIASERLNSNFTIQNWGRSKNKIRPDLNVSTHNLYLLSKYV